MAWTEVIPGIYMVGSGQLSGSGDCCVYAIGLADGGTCLVDAGTTNAGRILANLAASPLHATTVDHLVLTHCHYDHAGAASQFKTRFPRIAIIAHEGDVPAIEGAPGTVGMTAAAWYGETYDPVPVDTVLRGAATTIDPGGTSMTAHHAPGHTPGSIAILLDAGGTRVLFGQDIHGPFSPEFRSSIDDWGRSMRALLRLDVDVLCEGHFGVIRGREQVQRFITGYLEQHGR